MKLLTVFTPTFNRKNLLPRLYKSLTSQSNMNFIWMIIDDGSTDGTEELVKIWQQDKKLEILYFYKENEGMHSAHNWAYDRITTPWNTCIDSDDKMPNNAVQIIIDTITDLNDHSIECIVGLDSDFTGVVLGTTFPIGYDKVKINQFMKTFKITGDKKFVFTTSIMKKIEAYPLFKNEKLVPLNYKYLLAEEVIFFKPLNEILCHVEYQEDGSTKNMLKQYRRNPRGFAFSRINRINYGVTVRERFKNAVHLVSSALFSRDYASLFKTGSPFLVFLALPAGALLNLYIRLNTTKNC